MKLYYSDRAKEYERVYFRDDPIRQQEQINIQDTMKEFFKNRNSMWYRVLDSICATRSQTYNSH
ncbi:hypothetical protein SAMN04487944_1163 [Gracilibacillus ureilyticus]|uniref:Uncharacterized protein n=1 Tax=Gracilibacillus ureilyticus TaxID=531814 RepID=A0A1H9U411_9BACI|nr:hypothetical protein SAMN04487944_1163 [Gracilibacillus ureilyticus]